MFKFLLPTMIGMLTIPFLPGFIAATSSGCSKATVTRSTASKSREPAPPDETEEDEAEPAREREKSGGPRSRKAIARAANSKPAAREKSRQSDDPAETTAPSNPETDSDTASSMSDSESADADASMPSGAPDGATDDTSNETASTTKPAPNEPAKHSSTHHYLCLPAWTAQLELKASQVEKLLAISEQYASTLESLHHEQLAIENERDVAWSDVLTRDQKRELENWLRETLD